MNNEADVTDILATVAVSEPTAKHYSTPRSFAEKRAIANRKKHRNHQKLLRRRAKRR